MGRVGDKRAVVRGEEKLLEELARNRAGAADKEA